MRPAIDVCAPFCIRGASAALKRHMLHRASPTLRRTSKEIVVLFFPFSRGGESHGHVVNVVPQPLVSSLRSAILSCIRCDKGFSCVICVLQSLVRANLVCQNVVDRSLGALMLQFLMRVVLKIYQTPDMFSEQVDVLPDPRASAAQCVLLQVHRRASR